MMAVDNKESLHKLNDKWCLWAHLPHDTDWSIGSYKKIFEFQTVEEGKKNNRMFTRKLY